MTSAMTLQVRGYEGRRRGVIVRAPEERDDVDNQGRWWRLDFTMILVLLVIVAVLLIITSEFWHTHFVSH